MKNASCTESSAEKIPLLFNPKTKKIACVLMQAAHGLGNGNHIVQLFQEWDTGEGLSDYKGAKATREEWAALARVWNGHHAKRRSTHGR